MRGFTLIETIVAVMIFFVIFLALLQNSTQANHLERLALAQNNFYYKSSVAFIEHPTGSNLYETLRDFNITQDFVKDALKKIKLIYKEEIDSSEDVNLSDISFQKVIQRLITYDKEHRATIYTLKIIQ